MSDEKKQQDGLAGKQLDEFMGLDSPIKTDKPVVSAVAPSVAPAVPAIKAAPGVPSVPGVDPGQFALMLQIMLQREARLAKEEELKHDQKEKRDKQREFNAKHHYDAKIERQSKCRHKKGGKNGPKSGVVDYAVFYHTFINNESVIKCMLCGAKWKINDTDQFLVRNGRNIPNHTKIGWTRALEMVSQSTNTPTSSEIPLMVQSPVAGSSVETPEEVPNID